MENGPPKVREGLFLFAAGTLVLVVPGAALNLFPR